MAFIESQQNPGRVLEVDSLFSAGRVSLRPLDHTTLAGKVFGHYFAFGQTSAIAPAGNAVMGLCRWTDANNFAVILRVYTTVTVVTAVTAQRNDPLVLLPTRNYSAPDTTNATNLTITGNNQKARSNMGTSLMTNLAVASAAAGMSGGTKTNDANPIGAAGFISALIGLGTGLTTTELYRWDKSPQHPWLLTNSEGLLLNWGTTTLATGTVTVGFGIEWAEVNSF